MTTPPAAFSCVPVLSVLWLSLALSGCHTALQSEQGAWRHGTLAGTQFQHRYSTRSSNVGAKGIPALLHVYLEGDGKPFVRLDRVARDPTPAKSVVRPLMHRDPHAVLYVSRPCYDGLQSSACEPRLWTVARYGEAVVASMTAVIRELWQAQGRPQLTLIGHSGGGTLALLIASRLPEVHGVITVAGNLDTDSWAQHHGYSPLTQSLNPVNQRLSDDVRELHLRGGSDPIVPRASVLNYLADPARQRAQLQVCELSECRHSDCWRRIWAQVIDGWVTERLACAALTN